MKNPESKTKETAQEIINKLKDKLIFIGEKHYDFSYITLFDELLKTCFKEGLQVAIFSEFQSQTEKIEIQRKGGIENEPENSAEILTTIDKILSSQNKFRGYYEHYHEKQEKIRIAIVPEQEQKIKEEITELGEEHKKSIEEKYFNEWLKIEKEQIMQPRDADYAEAIRNTLADENYDIAIILTGGAHVRPIVENFGLSQSDFTLLSNQDPRGIGELSATKFEIDATKQIIIPGIIKEKLGQKSATSIALAVKPKVASTISDKQEQIRPDFLGPQSAVKKAIDGNLSSNSVIMVNPNEVYQDKILVATSDENKIGNPDDVAYMASIGKVLTARTAVEYFKNLDLKLSDLLQDYSEGRSTFVDSLKKLPHYQDITLANLLNHSAGLQQFSQKGFSNLTKRNGNFLTSEEILSQELDDNPDVEFGKFNYSNVGYELVGLILEHNSGKTLENLQRELVLKPVGLDQEVFLRDDIKEGENGSYSIKDHPDKNLLLGQHFDGKKVANLPNLSHHAGAGIYANPQSVARLAQVIWTQENLQQLEKYETLISDEGVTYGIGYIRNGDKVNHDGGMDGTRSSVVIDLETGKAGCVVATLENLTPKLALNINDVGPEEHYKEIQKLRTAPQEKLIEECHQKLGLKDKEAKKAEQEQKSGDSWVKKLGLEDKVEKPRSFLEAAQAGKYGNIGSKGGAHEL